VADSSVSLRAHKPISAHPGGWRRPRSSLPHADSGDGQPFRPPPPLPRNHPVNLPPIPPHPGGRRPPTVPLYRAEFGGGWSLSTYFPRPPQTPSPEFGGGWSLSTYLPRPPQPPSPPPGSRPVRHLTYLPARPSFPRIVSRHGSCHGSSLPIVSVHGSSRNSPSKSSRIQTRTKIFHRAELSIQRLLPVGGAGAPSVWQRRLRSLRHWTPAPPKPLPVPPLDSSRLTGKELSELPDVAADMPTPATRPPPFSWLHASSRPARFLTARPRSAALDEGTLARFLHDLHCAPARQKACRFLLEGESARFCVLRGRFLCRSNEILL
jgi:hypothetical protein